MLDDHGPDEWDQAKRKITDHSGHRRPVLLDIGCCQGGATKGYQRAGFYVIGIDIQPQPRYRHVAHEFHQADGLDVLRALIANDGKIWSKGHTWMRVDAIHTSWPCQGYTECQRIQGREHPRLIEAGRELLTATGLPYVQENVDSAETRQVMKNPIMLCGAAFGLHTYRHRLFESNIDLAAPPHPEHTATTVKMGRPLRDGDWYHAVGNFSNVPYVRRDLGMPWMNRDGLRESIPPVYAQWVGRQLYAHVQAVAS